MDTSSFVLRQMYAVVIHLHSHLSETVCHYNPWLFVVIAFQTS